MSEEEIEEGIRNYIKEHTTIIKAYTQEQMDKKDKEIERLNNKVEELMTLYTTERNVKEDYKAIIKEARELLKNDYFEDGSFTTAKRVFELLDKAEESL